jgi:RNA polymerase sigma factor (sigma-70 family)
MNGKEWLAEQFEANRHHLRAVAYRMLGSLSEADDAVQESWLRLSQSDASAIVNLGGWLTTVVARVCLDTLRSRKVRGEVSLGPRLPDPVLSGDDALHPEQQTLLADSVGVALLVVLETLEPAERLAFVLHDMFAVPFEEIGSTLGRSTAAARQLASRARRRDRFLASRWPAFLGDGLHRQRRANCRNRCARRSGSTSSAQPDTTRTLSRRGAPDRPGPRRRLTTGTRGRRSCRTARSPAGRAWR